MSNIIGNTIVHTVVPYVIGTTKPLDGQRLDVVFWKTGKDGVKRDSKCVSVPTLSAESVVSNITVLAPHIIDYLETIQHAIIKARVESNAAHITDEEISFPAIIEYLEASVSVGDGKTAHLTKESVAAWFDTTVADVLMIALADKLGIGNTPTDEETAKLDTAIKMYKDKISSLAGGKTSFGIPLAKSVKNALLLVSKDDVIASKFIARCDKMMIADSEMEFAL